MGLFDTGGNEIVRLLGREGTLLGCLGVFEICLSKMPRLPQPGKPLLGNSLYTM